MKCTECNGTGKSTYGYNQSCFLCNGSGVIEPMTNEEWFDTLSTEEKAKFFHSIVIRVVQATWDGKKPDYPAYLSDWKKWLKEKHNEM